MIDKDTHIECGWCGGVETAETWNDNTFKECRSREEKRAYTEIYKKKTFKRSADTFYKCKNCGRWSRGCQLKIVDTDDKELLSLGGEPIVKGI